jgi:hypothetical protein
LYGRLYSTSVGTKTLKLTATGGGASASDERVIDVEDLELPDMGKPDPPPPPFCPLNLSSTP